MWDIMHKTSYEKMCWFKNSYLDTSISLSILDIGSLDTTGDDYNYKSIFNVPNWDYTGLDFKKGVNVDIVACDIYNIMEINDNSYDVIISGQLFEHLEFFWITMSEIERILKPGGICCIIAPSGGPKHGASEPDCYRFYEDSMTALARYVNLEVLHVSTNYSEEAKPWADTCLVAKKENSVNNVYNDVEKRMGDLESRLDEILKNEGL